MPFIDDAAMRLREAIVDGYRQAATRHESVRWTIVDQRVAELLDALDNDDSSPRR